MTIRGTHAVIAAVVVALALAAGAAGSSARTPGALAVAEKYAELTDHWGTSWDLLAPAQQKFIPRALFVKCMSRIKSNRPKAIRITSVRAATITVPAPTPARVKGKLVRVHIDYGQAAPSQDATVKAIPNGAGWSWVNAAASRAQFVRQNFCRLG